MDCATVAPLSIPNPGAAAGEPGTDSRGSNLYPSGESAARASKSFTSSGRVSKPRILSGTVNAPLDLRKTENHLLRGGAPTAFRPPARLSRGGGRILQELKIKMVVRDERFDGIPLNVSFCGTLRPEQQSAAKAMLRQIQAFWPPQRLSAKQCWPPGSSRNVA